MRLLLLSLLTFISAVSCGSLGAQTTSDEKAAILSDTQWLHQIDSGDYPGAWKVAAKVMQSAAPEPNFAKAIGGARAPLGALDTRTLSSVQTTRQLPGAPDGLYVVAKYTAHFANKADAIETIVASQEPDGSWHVSGYFIR